MMDLLEKETLCEIRNGNDFLVSVQEETNNFGETVIFFVDENIPFIKKEEITEYVNSKEIFEDAQNNLNTSKSLTVKSEPTSEEYSELPPVQEPVCMGRSKTNVNVKVKEEETISLNRLDDETGIYTEADKNTESNISHLITIDEDGKDSKKNKPIFSLFESSPPEKYVEVFEKLSTQLAANKPLNPNIKVKVKETKNNEDRKKKLGCMISKSNEVQVFRHLVSKCNTNGQFVCSLCNYSFELKHTSLKHMRFPHKNQHTDGIKSKSLKNVHTIDDDKKTDKKGSDSTSSPSNKTKRHKFKFEQDDDGRFICPHCDSSYKERKHLLRHLRYKCGVEPQFKCTICSRRFRCISYLKTHFLNIHGDDKKSKSLKYILRLQKQNQIIDNDETESEKETNKRGTVRRSRRTSLSKKIKRQKSVEFDRDSDGRFICPVCNSSYKQRKHLIRHIRHECGIKPQFKCTICTRSFRRKYYLKTHFANIHADDKKSKSVFKNKSKNVE